MTVDQIIRRQWQNSWQPCVCIRFARPGRNHVGWKDISRDQVATLRHWNIPFDVEQMTLFGLN